MLVNRYDYDDAASCIVERLHDEWMYNQELSQRLVDSGNWTYNVDLKQVCGRVCKCGQVPVTVTLALQLAVQLAVPLAIPLAVPLAVPPPQWH